MHKPGLSLIEEYFKMSFIDIINILHWQKQESIKYLSDKCGISRDTFQRHAKKMGLKLRTNKDATKLTPNRGTRHWAFGKTKETSDTHKKHSARMKANNPSHNKVYLKKNMISFSKYLRDNPSDHEKIFSDFLVARKIKFIFQYPIEEYIIDFFIPSLNLCIELDSEKGGTEKKFRQYKKDAFLINNNLKILRFTRFWIFNKFELVMAILKAYKVII